MRCNDCNRFVSFDASTEPELNDVSFDSASMTFVADVRVVLTCQECGAELKAADLSVEGTLEVPLPEADAPPCKAYEHSWEAREDEHDLGMIERTVKVKGYRRTEYGVGGTLMFGCAECDLTVPCDIVGYVAPADMEDQQ